MKQVKTIQPQTLKSFYILNQRLINCWFSSFGDFSFYCAMQSNDFTDESKHLDVAYTWINQFN